MSHLLDDSAFVLRHDPKGMYALTAAFPEQCRKAVEIAAASFQAPAWTGLANVLLTGMGGSAAGGDFLKALMEAEGKLPFQVVRDYGIPGYVGPETLVLATSYSGNTEETLACYAQAKARGAKIVAITSGGKLAELATADGFPVITIPGGQPPRTAFGYLFFPGLIVLERMGLLPAHDVPAAARLLDECLAQWGLDRAHHENAAKKLGEYLHGKLVVLYGLGGWQAAVANRWKGQINENGKAMCFTHAYPELNHNEILGWIGSGKQSVDRWALVVLQDGSESAKMRKRDEVTRGFIRELTDIYDAYAPGSTLLEKMLGLVYMGDFVSLYLAALNEVDPENIDWLNTLKGELAKIAD